LSDFIDLEKQIEIIKMRVTTTDFFQQDPKGNFMQCLHGRSQDGKTLESLNQIKEENYRYNIEIRLRQQKILDEIQMTCDTTENAVRLKVKADAKVSLNKYIKSFKEIKCRGEEMMKGLEVKEIPLQKLIEAEKTKYEIFMFSVKSLIQELKTVQDTCVKKNEELNDQVADIENITLRLTDFTNNVMKDIHVIQKSLKTLMGLERV
jgi:hypothetical protein